MSTIGERQNELIALFSGIDDWEERYRKIIAMGKELDDIADDKKIDKYKVQGCQSQVWLHAELDATGKILFVADSDAMIVRGLIKMLLSVYSNATPREVLDTQPSFIQEIGLEKHLSPTRTNGLRSMVEQMLYYAKAFEALAKLRKPN